LDRNYSEGGLGIGGYEGLGDGQIDLNNQHIQIGGMGATHFWGQLTGGGTIDVGLFGGVEALQPQPHFILQANNKDWNGTLRVNARGFAIIKANHALGYGGEKRVYDGGSLALRSHFGNILGYGAPSDGTTLQITGAGIIRREGTDRIGALYNDGGISMFAMKVAFSGDTRFGARGDSGVLWLGNRVYNSTDNGRFIKVGPGRVILGGAGPPYDTVVNSWTGDTVIRGGALYIGHATALPTTSNIVFESGYNGLYEHGAYGGDPSRGGILELGYAGSGAGGVHNFTLGTGPGQLRWNGSGGFSAYGADRTVTLNNGATLYWGGRGGTPHFVKHGDALLLSSRYATHNITLTNPIYSEAGVSEIRVERGLGLSHAIITGKLGIRGSNSGYRKTGRGLLHWNTNTTAFSGTNRQIIIEGGALRVPFHHQYNTQLAGGVLGIDADYARNLGTGTGYIRWTGSGGFAAYGGTRKVSLNSGGTLGWGSTQNFLAANKELRFGHYTATGTVDFTNNLNLGTGGTRTIRIERGGVGYSRAAVLLSGAISGTAPLSFVGDGRIDLSADNVNSGTVSIYGAELRLNKQGRLASVANIHLSHGGTLFLDDVGTHDSNTGGSYQANRINDDATIDLQGGTIAYRRSSDSPTVEKVGVITIMGGQNSIQLFANQGAAGWGIPELHATELGHTGTRGTLHFSEKSSRLRLDTSASKHNITRAGGDGVIPWATAITEGNWQGFAQATTEGGLHYVKALDTYHTGAQDTWPWGGALNVRMTANQVLNANRQVKSLILGGGSLNLNGNYLIINSGGLIASGGGTRTITGSGTMDTSNTLYVHAFSNLALTGGARLDVGLSDLVKTQRGTLTLGDNVTHRAGRVYIHRGTLDLAGKLYMGFHGHITIGDGGGEAILKLAPDRWDQIVGDHNILPSITLNGTPYDPRGPEYGGDQAILRMGGNTKLHLKNLHIENRGTIDWVGGEASKANILWIDTLTFSGPDAQLFMRNWYEYEDILLVRKTNFNEGYLPQIVFEGYQNYETTYRQWDKDYWQIIPFGHLAQIPEPATWGSLLGILGLGLYLIRRRKRQKGRRTNECAAK